MATRRRHPWLHRAHLVRVLGRLTDAGETVVLVEHDMQFIAAADRVIELGPGGGDRGGTVVAEVSPSELLDVVDSITAPTYDDFSHVEARWPPGRSVLRRSIASQSHFIPGLVALLAEMIEHFQRLAGAT